MLARIQRSIVALIVAMLLGGACLAWKLERPAWAWVPPLLFAGGYAVALALEFLWLRRSYAATSTDRPTLAQIISAWLREVMIAPSVFLWRQPFRSAAIPDLVPANANGRRGVVLVHGFFCNRGLWNPWMRQLSRRGVPFVAVTLEPAFGSIDRYASIIDAAVARLEAATGLAPVLVGHSMGGLAIRAWLARDGRGERAHRVVTIGTPHRGTLLARHARTANGREMQVESGWLAALARIESGGDLGRFTCYWGHCDNIVFPTRSATLPGADNRHLAGTPHVAMAFHPDVFDHVLGCVEADAASPGVNEPAPGSTSRSQPS